VYGALLFNAWAERTQQLREMTISIAGDIRLTEVFDERSRPVVFFSAMLDLPLPLVRATESALVLPAASMLGALGINGAYRVKFFITPLEVVYGSDPSVDSLVWGCARRTTTARSRLADLRSTLTSIMHRPSSTSATSCMRCQAPFDTQQRTVITTKFSALQHVIAHPHTFNTNLFVYLFFRRRAVSPRGQP
jgi:hypothetical protein